jgi:DNA-binding LacI/PurR family transcriptional regulator
MKLDVASGGPLYQQLKQQLFSRIRRGEFAPGELLPSESQLCETYGVSAITTRRALLELVNEGVVRRRPGVGTIVAPVVRHAHIAFVSIDYRGDAWRYISAAMGELLSGIGELAWQSNATVSTYGMEEEEATERLRSIVEARSADGVLLRTANDVSAEHVEILENAGMPYVVIKRHLPRRPMNCVVSNDQHGGRLATTHLVEQGHTRIGFVCAKPGLALTQERLAGFREALDSGGVAYREELVRLESSFSDASGYQAVRHLLERTDRPTAIFVASDTMAIGGYQAARDLDLQIPDDIALVGYDDIAPATLLHPPLTTIRTALQNFGRLSAQLLLDLIDRRVQPPQRIVIEPELVVRGSSGPPPDKIVPLNRALRRLVASEGRLMSQRVVVTGRKGPLTEAVTVAVADAGGAVVPSTRVAEPGDMDAAVCSLDLRRSLEEGLERGLSDGETMARALATRGAGAVVLAAMGPDGRQGTGVVGAARAGLEELTRTLADRWSGRGVRVNGVLVLGADVVDVRGPCQFLLSEASAMLTGQVLIADMRAAR